MKKADIEKEINTKKGINDNKEKCIELKASHKRKWRSIAWNKGAFKGILTPGYFP